jgi:hypothetical protein
MDLRSKSSLLITEYDIAAFVVSSILWLMLLLLVGNENSVL